ncbi:MAG: cytochrome c oxidase assembly protein [Planctomycetota bacterium]|nr:cytochrome c oxidase assembly protein [Planctomycetota bacterium]MCX8039869.1 cytochrome c oxidase assembly protein [Planctomycetota bacterium]MDW8372172.1 cytochrome c oxidase assembly protein [Planctomycetota bacterium]
MGALASSRARLTLLLAGIPLAMAALAFFAMPPLYSLWCRLTGTGLRPNNPEAAQLAQPTGRFLEVFFESRVFDDLPVEFSCSVPSLEVEVGREALVAYRLRNASDRVLHIRPIHQVSPVAAAAHFGMRLCFCFNDQTLQPGEVQEFPVAFTFAPSLDPRIATVSICYSLFAISPDAPRSEAQLRIQRAIEGQGGVVSPNFRRLSEAELERLRAEERRGER